MMSMFDWVISKIGMFFAFLNSLVIVNFKGNDITLLGVIGAIVIIGVAIKLFMPKV